VHFKLDDDDEAGSDSLPETPTRGFSNEVSWFNLGDNDDDGSMVTPPNSSPVYECLDLTPPKDPGCDVRQLLALRHAAMKATQNY
jgi:hypothetical protein